MAEGGSKPFAVPISPELFREKIIRKKKRKINLEAKKKIHPIKHKIPNTEGNRGAHNINMNLMPTYMLTQGQGTFLPPGQGQGHGGFMPGNFPPIQGQSGFQAIPPQSGYLPPGQGHFVPGQGPRPFLPGHEQGRFLQGQGGANFLPDQGPCNQSRLTKEIISDIKSQGFFDQVRRECVSDADMKPAYRNLRQRVEGNVMSFLNSIKFSDLLNKMQIREQLRKHITESSVLETGVDRIVDQVVVSKINSAFRYKVEEVVYKHLGIEKPASATDIQEHDKSKDEDLLPKDLEAVSSDSSNDNHQSHNRSDEINGGSKQTNKYYSKGSISGDTNMSGTEQTSFKAEKEDTKKNKNYEEKKAESKTSHEKHTLSKSQKERKDDKSKSHHKSEKSHHKDKPVLKHGSQHKVKKHPENSDPSKKDDKERDKNRDKTNQKPKESKDKSSDKSNKNIENKVDKPKEKSDKERSHKEREHSVKDKKLSVKDKDASVKDKERADKSKSSKEKSEKVQEKSEKVQDKSEKVQDKSEKAQDKSTKDKEKSERDKSREKEKNSKHKSSGKDRHDRERSSSHKHRSTSSSSKKDTDNKDSAKEKSSSSKSKESSNNKDKHSSKSHHKHHSSDRSKDKSKSISSSKDRGGVDSKFDKGKKDDKSKSEKKEHKNPTDDHYYFKDKKYDRRSNDRDSNDDSSKLSKNNILREDVSNSKKVDNKDTDGFSSGCTDSTSNSDNVEQDATIKNEESSNSNTTDTQSPKGEDMSDSEAHSGTEQDLLIKSEMEVGDINVMDDFITQGNQLTFSPNKSPQDGSYPVAALPPMAPQPPSFGSSDCPESSALYEHTWSLEEQKQVYQIHDCYVPIERVKCVEPVDTLSEDLKDTPINTTHSSPHVSEARCDIDGDTSEESTCNTSESLDSPDVPIERVKSVEPVNTLSEDLKDTPINNTYSSPHVSEARCDIDGDTLEENTCKTSESLDSPADNTSPMENHKPVTEDLSFEDPKDIILRKLHEEFGGDILDHQGFTITKFDVNRLINHYCSMHNYPAGTIVSQYDDDLFEYFDETCQTEAKLRMTKEYESLARLKKSFEEHAGKKAAMLGDKIPTEIMETTDTKTVSGSLTSTIKHVRFMDLETVDNQATTKSSHVITTMIEVGKKTENNNILDRKLKPGCKRKRPRGDQNKDENNVCDVTSQNGHLQLVRNKKAKPNHPEGILKLPEIIRDVACPNGKLQLAVQIHKNNGDVASQNGNLKVVGKRKATSTNTFIKPEHVPVKSQKTTKSAANQRYTFEDLFKPRPVLSGTSSRRRAGRPS